MTHAIRNGGAVPLLAGVANLRDVGGHATADGQHVRRGLLYRSTELSHLDDADAESLAGLGIRTVFDLRTEAERAWQPDRLPVGIELVALDIIGGSPEGSPAAMMRLFEDPPRASAILGADGAVRMFERKYREFVVLDGARAGYGRLFRDLAGATHRPALVHCTTGKDRTGWAIAALLTLLGVPHDVVMADFLRSNDALAPAMEPFVERFVAGGGDATVLRPLIGVQPSYLDHAFDEVAASFGTIEGYFRDGLGLDQQTLDALRATFLEVA